jgi:nicotinamide mononucleotide (NMN) deamidase PncC
VDFTFALPQNRPEDRTRLEALRAELHQHLGDYIYADDEATTLEDCVAAPLVARGQTMALAEIGSGGGLAAALSHIAAAEDVLTGAFAAPSVERLRHVLQVPDDIWRGAQPSDQLALLARHAAQQAGGDWSVAVGPPEEDPPTRAAYLTMCVRQPDGTTRTSRHRWPGASSAAQDYMISEILDTLRRTIR